LGGSFFRKGLVFTPGKLVDGNPQRVFLTSEVRASELSESESMTTSSSSSSSFGNAEGAGAQSSLLSGEGEKVHYGLSEIAWLKIGIVAVLMAALFRFNLMRLWWKTNPVTGEANWGHSMFVPLVGIYYLYIHRDGLLKAKVRTAWSGLLILLAGILIFVYGIWPGQNDFVKDFGMVVTLFGLVLLLCGWEVMKIAWFPIVFLVCAIPWPGLVYSWVASPLQQLAANVAARVLTFVGVMAGVSGTKILIDVGQSQLRVLNVAEACAGMKSLMTFVSVAAAVAFLSARPMWQKVLLTMTAIPIAIFCNVMRVSGQGLLDHFVSQELSQSFAHAFVGTIMLIPGFFMILAGGWFMDKIFIEEAEEDSRYRPAPAAAAATATTWTRPDQKAQERVIEIPRSAGGAAAPAAAPAALVAKPQAASPVVPRATAPTKPTTLAAATPAAPKAPVTIPIPPAAGPRTAVMPPRPNIPRGGASQAKPPVAAPPASVKPPTPSTPSTPPAPPKPGSSGPTGGAKS